MWTTLRARPRRCRPARESKRVFRNFCPAGPFRSGPAGLSVPVSTTRADLSVPFGQRRGELHTFPKQPSPNGANYGIMGKTVRYQAGQCSALVVCQAGKEAGGALGAGASHFPPSVRPEPFAGDETTSSAAGPASLADISAAVSGTATRAAQIPPLLPVAPGRSRQQQRSFLSVRPVDACPEYPCNDPLLRKPKVRAFLDALAERGPDKVMDLLERSEQAGAAYRRRGGL